MAEQKGSAAGAVDHSDIRVAAVFLNRAIIVEHYKTIAEGINNSKRIQDLAEAGPVAVITKKKSGFTRQLLIGPLEAQPFEYSEKDWEFTTQRYKHLPDLVYKRDPKLMIVVCEDVALLIGILRTIYAQSSRPLTEADARHIIEAAEMDLRIGDVVLYNRDGYSDADPGGIFDICFSLDDSLHGNVG